ncbi:MAG: ATP-binding protein, partial [Nocardioides sp.]
EAADGSASTGVAARVSQREELRAVLLPARVAEAVCGAVAEALRNVGRHAGVPHADVVLSVVGEAGLLVEILDRGHGLQPGFAPGFGLRRSVIARLSEVGGEAHVEARPGGGTRVTLRWQPPRTAAVAPPDVQAPELARIPRNPRLFAAAFSAVLLVGALYLAARYPTADGSRWGDALVCLGVIGYLAWVVLAVPRPVALRYAHQAGFLVLPGLLAVGLYTAGESGLRSFDCWIVGLSGIPVVLLAMVRPTYPVLALAGLESAVVTAAAVLDPTITPLDVLSPITQTPMFVGLVVYGVSAIARVRRAADAHEVALSSALARSQEVAAREHALGSHYAWLSSEVRPFLEAVADAEADPDESEVQQRAGVLALAVRDELSVPAQLPEAFRQHIASARQRGIRVRVRASDQWSPTTGHSKLEELLGLLSGDESLTDITLSLPRTSAPLRVVVRPRLSTLQHSAAVRLLGARLLDIDEDDLASIITLHPGQPEYA